MSTWSAHVTVATVVERNGKYLLVEEADKTTGAMVFNQPAGHLEAGESLQQAAVRETLEETGWHIELTGMLGVALYNAVNGVTYYRTTFLGIAVKQDHDAQLDPDITAVHWLDYASMLKQSARMRSPLVIKAVELARKGQCYPLDFIYHP